MKPLRWGEGRKRENQKAVDAYARRVSRLSPHTHNPKGAAPPVPVTLPYLKFLDPAFFLPDERGYRADRS